MDHCMAHHCEDTVDTNTNTNGQEEAVCVPRGQQMRPPAIAFQRQQLQRQQRTLTLDSLRPSRSDWRLSLISSMATESYAGSLDADSRSITLMASMQRQPKAMVVPMMTAAVVALFIGWDRRAIARSDAAAIPRLQVPRTP